MDQAVSYDYFKQEVKNWISKNFPEESTILDVGAGCGTYWRLLHDKYKNIDAVEVYKQNIIDHNLESKYRTVFNDDIVGFNYDGYDLIIFGDVIEHLTIPDAQSVLEYAYDRCKDMIVAVPYMYPQHANENKYEEHKQPDLTIDNVLERYPMLKLLYGNNKYGYYIKK